MRNNIDISNRGDKIVVEVMDMRYRIGYKQRGQWRYFEIVGTVEQAMKHVEKLFYTGYTQVTIKSFKSEV